MINIFKYRKNQLFWLTAAGFSFFSSIGGVVYYFSGLSWPLIILSYLSIIISIFFLKKKSSRDFPEEINGKQENEKIIKIILSGLYICLTAVAVFFLYNAKAEGALLSPWDIVSKNFFIVYFLATFSLAYLLSKIESRFYFYALSFVHFLLSISVAAIVYPLAYGFDPFIHGATIDLIIKNGEALPKQPYYAGYYSLISLLNAGWRVNAAWLNHWLTLILAAGFLPLAVFQSFNSQEKRGLSVLLISFLIWSLFISATPQSLAYVWLILSIAAIAARLKIFSLLFAVAAAITHPLAGIPALIFFLIDNLNSRQFNNKKKEKWLLSIAALLMSLLIPAALIFVSGGISSFSLNNFHLLDILKNLIGTPSLAGDENFLLNSLYFIFYNRQLIILLLLAALIFQELFSKKEGGILKVSAISALTIFLSFVLSCGIKNPGLIDYEQNAYSTRILNIIILISIPLIASFFNRLILTIENHPKKSFKLISILFIAILGTACLYLSYPRFDKYYNSHSFSTSIDDLETVKKIDKAAEGKPYIVLANQQVGAAALSLFGFEKQVESREGKIYFYPIPTSGSLYEYYLKMVYDYPGQEKAIAAMDFSGTEQLFLVINPYWNESGRISNEAKISADDYFESNGGIWVFHFKRH